MEGTDMRIILSVAAFALVLAGCAGAYDKSAAAPACKSGADHAAALRMFGPGVMMGDGHVIPARNLNAGGKLDAERANSTDCIRQEHDEEKSPKSYDFHKIGMAL
jgi:hypothetical protein